VNGRFVNQLRKEFLIWHTLDQESKAFHSQVARDLIDVGDGIFASGGIDG
jgi:hypothetical protein